MTLVAAAQPRPVAVETPAATVVQHKRPPWEVVSGMLAFGVVLVVGFGAAHGSWQLLIAELLVAIAALIVGGFLGFLFGMPKSGAPEPGSAAATDANLTPRSANGLQPSTNLEQVADWLTKILVGVGLVQLADLKRELGSFGDRFGATFATATGVSLISQLVLVSFLVLGFLASFLWTRIYYGKIQKDADSELLERVLKAEEKAEKADNLSSALATGRVKPQAKPSSEARSMAAAPRDVREADPMSTLPDDVHARVEQLQSWSEFDWDSDPAGELFADAPAQANGRRLTAEIEETLKNKALHIRLRVAQLPGGAAIESPVLFLLHPTYRDRVEVSWPVNGSAELQIISEGTFTVVAIVDGGNTILAFDLAKMPNAPQWFKDQ